MPQDPEPTPTNYQRTTGGHLRWQPPLPEHLQSLITGYEVTRLLGHGGMGAVYKARQVSLDREVAIKILPPEAADSDLSFVERFKNEARAMARMNHPSIVGVFDFGETREGHLFIVMEYVDGTDVSKMIMGSGKLPPEHALSITAHVCDALQYAHSHGIIHRDIKPANIMVSMDGQIKVADFGLAKSTDPSQSALTQANMAMGTPDFVSPEALSPGMVVDHRADLYAIGVMLYQMLTGDVPRGMFQMPSLRQPGLDPRFDKIIVKAMEMDREMRYQQASEIRTALDVILSGPVVQAQAQPPQQQAAPPRQAQQPDAAAGPPRAQPPRTATVPGPHRGAQRPPATAAAPRQARGAGKGWLIGGGAAAAVALAAALLMPKSKPAPAPAPAPVPTPTPVAAAVAPAAPAPSPAPPAGAARPPGSTPSGTAPTAATTNSSGSGTSPSTATTPAAPPPTTLAAPGHRYRFVLEKTSWADAEKRAAAMGGHLATLNEPEQTDQLRKMAAELQKRTSFTHFHVGGLQDQKGGPWRWVTGEPFHMSSWCGTVPDGSGSRMAIHPPNRPGNMDDVSPSFQSAFIVEWDDTPPASLTATGTATAPATPSLAAPSAPVPSPPPSPRVTDPRLLQLESGFRSRYETDAAKPFAAGLAALNNSYITNGIARARAASQAKGSLDEVTALDVEKRAVESGAGVPPADVAGTPDAVKALRATYRTALDRLTTERDLRAAPLYDLYLQALDAYVMELTRGDRIEEAKSVSELCQRIAAQKPSPETTAAATAATAPSTAPAAGAGAGPAASPASATTPAGAGAGAASSASRGTPRQLAEWVFSQPGGEIRGMDGRQNFTARSLKEMPAGKITVNHVAFRPDKTRSQEATRLVWVAEDLQSLNMHGGLLEDLSILRSLPNLRRLSLGEGGPPPPEFFEPVSSLVNLEAFVAGNMQISGSFVEKWTNLTKLKDFILFNSSLDPLNLPALARLKSLRNVELSVRNATDEQIALLAQLPDLEFLRIRPSDPQAPSFTGRCVAAFTACPKLRTLSYRMPLTPEALEGVLSLKDLRDLALEGGAQLTGPMLASLTSLGKLERLALRRPPDPASLAEFKNLPNLRSLSLGEDECKITDDGIRTIAATFPTLTDLVLGDWDTVGPFTNAGATAVAAMTSLRSLTFCGSDVDDRALNDLAKLRDLASLNLSNTKVTGSGFAALARLEKLVNLVLNKTPVTDAALAEIAKFKSLRTLNIADTSISQAAVTQLKQARPGLQVIK